MLSFNNFPDIFPYHPCQHWTAIGRSRSENGLQPIGLLVELYRLGMARINQKKRDDKGVIAL